MPTHTRGTTFSDTDPTNRRVTAARLHQLVEEAVHTSGGIGTSAIADSAVTDAKVATGISGTKVSAATLALTALAGGTQGDLITRGGSNYETLGIGTARYPLVVNSGATGLEYAQLTQAAIGASVISGHSALSDPAIADALLVYDDSAGVNLKVTLENLYKSMAGLTEETTVAADDEVLVYDTSASAPRRMSRSNFVSGLGSSGEFYATHCFQKVTSDQKEAIPAFGQGDEFAEQTDWTTFAGSDTHSDPQRNVCGAPFAGELVGLSITNIDTSSTFNYVANLVSKSSLTAQTGTSLGELDTGDLAPGASESASFSSSNTFSSGDLLVLHVVGNTGGTSTPASNRFAVFATYKFTIS